MLQLTDQVHSGVQLRLQRSDCNFEQIKPVPDPAVPSPLMHAAVAHHYQGRGITR
jgi:hypothetical protein